MPNYRHCTLPLRLTWATSRALAGTTGGRHIDQRLALNPRIKLGKRLVRERPEPWAVTKAINQVWSMEFMNDQLEDGPCFRYSTC
jgi:hypothetical protein